MGEYIAALLASARLGNQVTHHRPLPGAEPVFTPNRLPWPRAVGKLLEECGVRLYSHQALATDHIRAGHAVVVVATPTASGKSLIYNLPVLERHLHDPDARALYLFPLKALAQDQLAAFSALTAAWPEAARPTVALYDGDTSDHFRRKIWRDPPTVLVSNPEMLHLGILPHHEQWAAFLAGLSFVVVDEAHTYRGVFGAHMAQVFRRLNRLAGRYGARPTYVLCTATVGNPGELAAGLIGSVDGFRAWRETHPGAVYLHRGRTYVIEEVDPGRARILAKEARVSWFTRMRGQKSTDILEETERRALGRALVCRGRLRITERITGYEKRSTSGNRLLTIVPLDAPP